MLLHLLVFPFYSQVIFQKYIFQENFTSPVKLENQYQLP